MNVCFDPNGSEGHNDNPRSYHSPGNNNHMCIQDIPLESMPWVADPTNARIRLNRALVTGHMLFQIERANQMYNRVLLGVFVGRYKLMDALSELLGGIERGYLRVEDVRDAIRIYGEDYATDEDRGLARVALMGVERIAKNQERAALPPRP